MYMPMLKNYLNNSFPCQGTEVISMLYAAHQDGKKNIGIDLGVSLRRYVFTDNVVSGVFFRLSVVCHQKYLHMPPVTSL